MTTTLSAKVNDKTLLEIFKFRDGNKCHTTEEALSEIIEDFFEIINTDGFIDFIETHMK